MLVRTAKAIRRFGTAPMSAATMGAVRVAAHGGPEVMSLERVPLLTAADCSADECVVEVHRAGLNFIGASPGERPAAARDGHCALIVPWIRALTAPAPFSPH